jgi:hypothetical protein
LAAQPSAITKYQQGFGPPGFTFSTNEFAAFLQDQWRFSPRLTLNLGLRYEVELLPSAQISNPSFAATGVLNSDMRDFGPRVGFAWDVNGNGRTAIRGGYGIYYGRMINGSIFQAISNTGSSASQVQATIFPSSNGSVGPIYPTILTSLSGTIAKPSIVFLPADARNPMIHEWDIVFEREIAPNTEVSVSWIGSLGHFLPTPIDINLPAPGSIAYTISGGPLNGNVVAAPFFRGARPNPLFNQITMLSTSAHSIYNGGVLQLNRRFTRGLQFQASYTLADSRDDNNYGVSATPSGNGPSNASNLGYDEGPSNFDVRHRAIVSLVWQPSISTKAAARCIGWRPAGPSLPFSPLKAASRIRPPSLATLPPASAIPHQA